VFLASVFSLGVFLAEVAFESIFKLASELIHIDVDPEAL
jgi:hypothetical protein